MQQLEFVSSIRHGIPNWFPRMHYKVGNKSFEARLVSLVRPRLDVKYERGNMILHIWSFRRIRYLYRWKLSNNKYTVFVRCLICRIWSYILGYLHLLHLLIYIKLVDVVMEVLEENFKRNLLAKTLYKDNMTRKNVIGPFLLYFWFRNYLPPVIINDLKNEFHKGQVINVCFLKTLRHKR